MKRIAFIMCSLVACGDGPDPAAETAPEVSAETLEEATAEVGPEIEATPETVETIETTPETEVSEDTEAVADTDATTPDDDLARRFELAGAIAIVEIHSDGLGGVAGTYVQPDLRDGALPTMYVERAAAGACRVWTRTDATCTPCAEGTTCDASGTCVPIPESASAGTLTITGLVASPMTATPGEFGYTVSPEPPNDGLFDAGDAITVAASGAAIAPFEASVRGVADLQVDGLGFYELVDDKAQTITWQPANDGSDIEVVLQVGWHGAPPTGIIACRAPDSAGSLVIEAAVINPLPYLGNIALFQNPSWIERVSRTIVEATQGPIEVSASSRVNLGFSHEPE